MTKSKYKLPHTVDLPVKVDLTRLVEAFPTSSAATTILATYDLAAIPLPIPCNVYHKVCAKRAGIKAILPFKVGDQRLACTHCGKALRRTKDA